MTATQIPDKFHFKIGEVSRILGVKPYVLRFWETEFRITPAKNRSQHRVYKRQEVETLLEIKRLLYEERFTIEGARVKLKEQVKDRQKQLKLDLLENPYRATLRQVRKDLARIKAILK
ncbi:MAG: MerR family transcriptional regulator [Deltaproteobacteria bacterium]|nr:MAG: MerR family transcriptional regulator [Deltaproteobacteria bacterium]